MRRTTPSIAVLLFIVAASLARPGPAAAQEVLQVDLAARIEEAARHRTRFAVDVPHRFATSTHGQWTTRGATREWTYSVRIPSAISMSFHAQPVQLPASARLTVSASSASSTYRASNAPRASIWGRPLLGDTLTFRLSVGAAEASQVRFEVASLQAGYRALSPGVPDHPHYRRLGLAKAGAAPCIENYSCHVTDANRGPAKATVALLIGNTGQCTGTLLNNARQDGRPYVLTARHCENGELGGSAPHAAENITVYWDAVTPCGAVVDSLYFGGAPIQQGATTVVEQQDAWLIELDDDPEIADPYYAGWDATGATFVGGYSVHHASGLDQQFTSWHGQALLQHIPGATLGAPYDSDFWGLVNSVGSVSPGASGGALFDPSNRVVGNGSLAWVIGDKGVCPAAVPQVPTAGTVTAQYTALSAVWNATDDASSTTGATTLRNVLDPDDTGRMTLDAMGIMPLVLNSSGSSARFDEPVGLSWNAPWAQSCTASGGLPGDGWAGQQPATGSVQVRNETSGGEVRYELTCTGGERHGTASTSIHWHYIPPAVGFVAPRTRPVMIGSSFELRWDSNVGPCTASDGLPGDGWAGPKAGSDTQLLVATRLGAATYTITCGTGLRVAATQLTIQVVAPSVTLFADATRLRVGAPFNIWWRSDADGDNCSGSGGVPSWPPNTQNVRSNDSTGSSSSVAGTFTYTMTCSGGGLSASSSVTVEFVDEPATSTLTAVAATQAIFESHPGIENVPPNLQWTSNAGFCTLSSIGPVGNTGVELRGQFPSGTATAIEFIAGTYEYQLNCIGTPIARATIEWVAANPRVWLTDEVIFTEPGPSSATWIAGHQHQLFWSANATPCTASGGAAGDGWAGLKDSGVHGAQSMTAPTTPGTYTYSLTCGTGVSQGTADFVVTIPPTAVTLTATPASTIVDQTVWLEWSSTAYPCAANADGAGVSWAGSNMNYTGRVPVQQATPGTYTYTISCGTGAQTASASTQVTVSPPPPVALTASATSVPVNTPVTLTWDSGVNLSCSAVGGTQGDGWFGSLVHAGSTTVTSSVAQTVGYTLACAIDSRTVFVTYTAVEGGSPSVQLPAVTLTASRQSQVAGQPITLIWSSSNSTACVASGGSTNDGWAGTTSLSGTMSVTRSNAGDATYLMNCVGATPAATAQTTVTFTAAPGTGGGNSGGGGGGGGGALDRYLLLLLTMAAIAQIARRRRGVCSPFAKL